MRGVKGKWKDGLTHPRAGLAFIKVGDEGVEPPTPRCKHGVMPFHQSPILASGRGSCSLPRPRLKPSRSKGPVAADPFYRSPYIENELPQPQVLLALGLVMLKPRLLSSS